MKAAIQTIRNHADAIMDTINMFALDEEIAKCSKQINASIREIQVKVKYLEIKAQENKRG